MMGVLWVFLQAAAGQILYLTLRLESSSYPHPLSVQEEREAFARLQRGEAAARDVLIRHNLRLVAHVVKKYYSTPDAQDDLISMGTIGLIKAVDSFDPARGIRFASYASQCIENELRMHLRRTRRQGTAVSLQEPLDSSAGDGGTLTIGDVLPDPAAMEADCERRDTARQIRCHLQRLPPRERELLNLRYGLDGTPPMTQQQAAEHFGISRSYVSRLETRALARLRDILREGESC